MNPFAFAAYLAVHSLSQAPAVPQGPISIEQAVSIAERRAFSVRISRTALERSRQQFNESLSALGPRLSTALNYNRFDRAITGNFGGGGPAVIISPIDQSTVSATFALPIDIAGNSTRLARASQLQIQASRESLVAALNDARQNARTAYIEVLRAKATVQVFDQVRVQAETRLTQARQQFAEGQIAKVDVDRFDAQVAQAISDQIEAKNRYQLAMYAFNLTLALPIESVVDVQEIAELPKAPEGDDLTAIAVVTRPELAALQRNLEALANVRRSREAGLSPSLSLSVTHQRVVGTVGAFALPQQTTGNLNLSLPLFDSGATRARVKQARQDEEQAKVQLEQQKLLVSQEVRSASTSLVNALARLKNAERQVQLAQEVFRINKVRRDAGEGTYVEIIDSETSLTQARNGLVGARYDYLVAFAQLQRAVGSDTLARKVPPSDGPKKTGGAN